MKRVWWSGVMLAMLAACGLAADSTETTLQNFGPAPELTNDVWLNTSGPLRLADLRGQVVLIDMWTFG
jgi:hypothetical protein